MEKKHYQKPGMHVVMMKYHSHLLAGLSGESESRSYRWDDDE